MVARHLELDSAASEIRIRFSYDEQIKEIVKGLRGRRWNPEGKFWSVPRDRLEDTARTLIPYGFQLSDELQALVGDDMPEPGPAAQASAQASAQPAAARPDVNSAVDPLFAPRGEPTLSISQLNDGVRGALNDAFPRPLWVEGEVVGYERNAHKKHIYFELADKEEGEPRARAVVTVVLFAGVRQNLLRDLADSASGLELKDGLRIRIRGRVELYAPHGSYQFILDELDPEFTLGEIVRRRERVLAEIDKRGLRELNRSLGFPCPCLRVGLITSFGSDAYNDFVNELGRSGHAFDVQVADVHVQGDVMEREVLAALAGFARRAQDLDVLAIVRGGGARTDLMDFDTLDLGLAVAQHPLKVVVGIGHYRDQSVLDMVAHSEKTPTAAAQLLVAMVDEQLQIVEQARRQLLSGVAQRLESTRAWLTGTAGLLCRTLQVRFERARGGVRMYTQELRERARQRVAEADRRHARQRERLQDAPRRVIRSARERIATRRERVERGAGVQVVRARERLQARMQLVRAVDPRRLLARGYTWLRAADGRGVRSVTDVTPGTPLRARLPDGELDLTVEDIRPDQP